MKYFVIFLVLISFTGITLASEYSGETPLYLFDYLEGKPIAYIVEYNIDGYLRNAVVDFDSNMIIFEIKNNGTLTVEIPKTHFLPNDYFPTLLIDKTDKDPREFLIKDEECFKEYRFSVNQSTMIELIMDKSQNDSSVVNENILVSCQNKMDSEITDTFDFNTIFEDSLEYIIIDGKQYLSKTIKSSLVSLTHNETIFELSEIKFHFYDKREDIPRVPGMGIMGLRTPVLFEFPDGATKEMFIKIIPTPQDMSNEQYAAIETYARPNWPEIGIVAGLTSSNQITKLLVFEKNISPYVQLQQGIEPENISCKVDLGLIQKYDGAPSCVKEQSIPKLIERGWALPKDEQTRGMAQISETTREQNVADGAGLSITPEIINGKNYLVFEGTGWHRLHNVEITITDDDGKNTASIRSKTNDNGVLHMPWPLPENLPRGLYRVHATDGIHQNDFVISIPPEVPVNIRSVSSELEVDVSGEKQVRRGTTHSIEIQVDRDKTPVEDAQVFIRIEDYGENIVREFHGRTNQQGYFVFSWEIPKKFDDIETLLAFVDVTDGISSKTELFKLVVYCLPGEKGCKTEGR